MPTIRVDEEVFKALQIQAEPLVDTPNSVLRRLLRLDAQAKGLKPSPAERRPDGLRALNNMKVELSDPPPKRLRLPNGEERRLGHWNSLLLEVARYLVKLGKLGRINCPVQLKGARRYLVHTDQRHPNGRQFFSPILIGNGLWLEANADACHLHRQARALLEQFREDPSLYRVECS